MTILRSSADLGPLIRQLDTNGCRVALLYPNAGDDVEVTGGA